MRVKWSARAAAEFAATAAYVAHEFGEQAARKMQCEINEGVSNIEHFPMIGKESFTDEKTGIVFRELVARLNSIVYAIYNEEIYIVSIWSNRRDRSKLYETLINDAK
jgi:plasmid stabilization system protein ParE